MAKCVRCGKSFLTRGRIKLADADICFKCFDELGFDHKTGVLTGSTYKWNDICNGWDAYIEKKYNTDEDEIVPVSIKLSNYGEKREVDATDEEMEMFELIQDIVKAEDMELVRKADNYVTAVIGEWDLARFKYTNRAKWIEFPMVEYGKDRKKNRIESVENINQYAEQLKESLSLIRKYSDV